MLYHLTMIPFTTTFPGNVAAVREGFDGEKFEALCQDAAGYYSATGLLLEIAEKNHHFRTLEHLIAVRSLLLLQ